MWSIRFSTVKEPIETPVAERHTHAIYEVGVVHPIVAPIALGPTHAPHALWKYGNTELKLLRGKFLRTLDMSSPNNKNTLASLRGEVTGNYFARGAGQRRVLSLYLGLLQP